MIFIYDENTSDKKQNQQTDCNRLLANTELMI